MKDNQGRDLASVKKHFDYLEREHRKGAEESSRAFQEAVARHPLADWTSVEDTLVLRAGSSRYVAVPKNGKRSASAFEVIDLVERVVVVPLLKKDEVRSWLWQASISEDE